MRGIAKRRPARHFDSPESHAPRRDFRPFGERMWRLAVLAAVGRARRNIMGAILLWLLGIPIPIIIILALLSR
jgi:hypothetical protein